MAFKGSKASEGINWDLTNDPLPTWRALEALVESGKVKNIGISNFTIARAKALLKDVSSSRSAWNKLHATAKLTGSRHILQAKIAPAVNQVELNLRCAQPELVKVHSQA